ncbi:MAG: hypothetical protein J6X88_07275 [Bacteroidales bacterium]|nr:hypothetical protein [Bacteroidales bacterium]MBP5645726.1 hypothetical protein [Bacteroidales bacterium]
MSNKEIPDSVKGWLKFILKVAVYAAGLLMAGYGTAEACNITSLFPST